MTSETCMNESARTLEQKTNISLIEPGYEENNKNFDLEYYLLEGAYDGREEEFAGTRVYGIEIVKLVKGTIIEKDAVTDFSSDKARTIKALKLLGESKVTPVTFRDILQDIVAEQF